MNTEWVPPTDATPPAHLRTDGHASWAVRSLEPDRLHEEPVDVGTEWTPAGRLVNLRFLRSALRRLRWLWISTAVLGLVLGTAYHLLIPLKYNATATLYLSQSSVTTGTNDLAMLNTLAVSKRAIALLGEHGIRPTSLLGKQPGAMTGDNVLVLTISGPSPREAVRRVDAVAQAFLAFRAARYAAENRAVVAAERRELSHLQSQVAALSSAMATLPSTSPRQAALKNQRGIDTTQIVGLEASIQQTALNTLALSKGSKVISPGTALPVSKKKVFGLDGLSGLAGGLGVGLLLAVVIAILSDRPRTREDVASVLGAPVDLSLGRAGMGGVQGRSIWRMAADPDPNLATLARYLGDHLPRGVQPSSELVLAIDDVGVTAAALLVLANELAESGRQSVLVDATHSRELARAFGIADVGTWAFDRATGPPVQVYVPPQPWEERPDVPAPLPMDLDRADTVLVLGTVNPSVGAHHLRRWGSEAVVVLAAGGSSAQRIGTTGELLRAADIAVASAVLLRADPRDETAGRAARLAWDW